LRHWMSWLSPQPDTVSPPGTDQAQDRANYADQHRLADGATFAVCADPASAWAKAGPIKGCHRPDAAAARARSEWGRRSRGFRARHRSRRERLSRFAPGVQPEVRSRIDSICPTPLSAHSNRGSRWMCVNSNTLSPSPRS
jgi:hypothetical protein